MTDLNSFTLLASQTEGYVYITGSEVHALAEEAIAAEEVLGARLAELQVEILKDHEEKQLAYEEWQSSDEVARVFSIAVEAATIKHKVKTKTFLWFGTTHIEFRLDVNQFFDTVHDHSPELYYRLARQYIGGFWGYDTTISLLELTSLTRFRDFPELADIEFYDDLMVPMYENGHYTRSKEMQQYLNLPETVQLPITVYQELKSYVPS